ncbi:MAG: N-acetylneuraminic acid mutarotase, partial [Gammaproteobacteria bacterium]
GSAKAHFYSLDLAKDKADWQALPDFPGGERGQPVVASVGGKLFVFGGLQKNADGVLQIINDVHVYDPESKTWKKCKTRAPFSMVGTSAFVRHGKIYFVGGVNLEIFNGYFQDYTAAGDDQAKKDAVMAAYFDKPAKDYFFNQYLFSYEPKTHQWQNEGLMPFAGRAGAAVSLFNDRVIVANGEIKPGLRTDAVESGEFKEDSVKWVSLPALIPNEGEQQQEGVAGAYVGTSDGHYLLAGGANFPGAKKQYAGGMKFAHKGLKKAYHDSVFTFENGNWKVAGKLPKPAAYGTTLNYKGKMLVIGGKNNDGAMKTVYTLKYDSDALKVD